MTEEATDDDFRKFIRDILGNLRWIDVTPEKEQQLVSLTRQIYQKALNDKEISSSLFEDLDLSATQELRIKRVLAEKSATAFIRDHLQLANQLAYTYSQPLPPYVPAEIYDGEVRVANVMVDIRGDEGILTPLDRASIVPLNKALVVNQRTLTLRCSEGTFSIRSRDAEEARDDVELEFITWDVWLDKSIDN